MTPLLLVLLGMAIVLCGVLVFKLHAFLALIIAALVVAALTPQEQMLRQHLEAKAFRFVGGTGGPTLDDPRGNMLRTMTFDIGSRGEEVRQTNVFVIRRATLEHVWITDFDVSRSEGHLWIPDDEETGEQIITPDDLYVLATDYRDGLKASEKHIAQRVAEGFGKTCIDIGILIALAAIIGECLLASGAAERIVRSTLRLVGEKRAPSAFLGSGFLLGIPVFFDTVFYLLIPLAKAMRMKTGKHYLLYVLTIVAGATMTHSLVPPTPGPLYAASAFKVDVGVMILGGLAVSIVTAMVGYAYAVWADRRWDIPLRDTAEGGKGDLEALAQKDDGALPPLWLSLLPIVLPVVLIAGSAVVASMEKSLAKGEVLPTWLDAIAPTLALVGNKNLAILLAALIAMATMALYKRGEKGAVNKAVNTALTSGGLVILITAAGGAFGAILRQTGVAGEIQGLAEGWHIAVLPLAFLVTTLVRTAQGSATVAMITAAAIFAPVVEGDTLAFHAVYLALAVGCGSKPIMWMNDSGFWVITKMTGLKEAETLRTATVMMILMALAGLTVIMIGATVMPMK